MVSGGLQRAGEGAYRGWAGPGPEVRLLLQDAVVDVATPVVVLVLDSVPMIILQNTLVKPQLLRR